MATLASEKADAPTILPTVKLQVVGCDPKASIIEAFASNFYLGDSQFVRFSVIIGKRVRVVQGLLYAFNSPAKSRCISIGGRLSFASTEAPTDRDSLVEFSADLTFDDEGELMGTGELRYQPTTITR